VQVVPIAPGQGKVTFGKSGIRAWQLEVPQLVLTPVEFVSKTELTILRPFRVELDGGRIFASASFWAFAFGNIMPATAITAVKISLLACILECKCHSISPWREISFAVACEILFPLIEKSMNRRL
jgi:hypothetical protein